MRARCLLVLAMALLVAACQLQREYHVERSRTYAQDRQAVWDRLMAFLERNQIAVTEADFGSGRIVAERLNAARGPVRVVAPTRGFSLADVEGGDLWDPEADAAFLEALASGLRPDIPYEPVETHVNDPALADLVAGRYLSLMEESAHA